ncbi:DUF262 domain-containing protein [Chromobacterium paludis]|uniref:DUF262 domain-containing protein n=1 Tax=Chromobacterium paludis TaxID=2605945 RepID=A0A5C1DM74_9NEIS|nr:DUF262 domain-containing protein [Chromobacterium paludis]QEL57207.1 DUF262 domain-containing protein [Chromobacterium paludis]
MALDVEIEKWRGEIKTDSYSMSIGELINLYRDGELNIKPKYQRFFRWSIEQKSKFIESILLGIPVPSLFMAQDKDGIWEVVDGLQRLSTIFQFVGILKSESGEILPQLCTKGTRYLPSLEGKRWEVDGDDNNQAFSTSQRIDFKRAKLNVNIIQRESQRFTKYELFQRLNTGGSSATFQEVLNCMLIDTNEEFYDWFESLGKDENFIDCCNLSDSKIEEQYDLELVSRFIVFYDRKVDNIGYFGSISDYLAENMLAFASDPQFDKEMVEERFRKTFKALRDLVGENCFRRYDAGKSKFLGGFLISAFEAIALGVAYHIDEISESPKRKADLPVKVKKIWGERDFQKYVGVGRTADYRINNILTVARNFF